MSDTERDRLAAQLAGALELEQQEKRTEAALQLLRDQQTDERIAAALASSGSEGGREPTG